MKRCISLFLLAVLLFATFSVNCFASEITEEYVVERFEDGSYMTERVVSSQTRASGTKSGSKDKVYYNGNGVAEWKVTVSGTFTYTGSSATCTSANCSVSIYNSDWYTISKSATKSGNTATAYATMGEKLLGVKVDEVSTSVSLKCDNNGNLS